MIKNNNKCVVQPPVIIQTTKKQQVDITSEPEAIATVATTSVGDRDKKVLYDAMYPPIGRSDKVSTDMLMREPVLRGTPTRYPSNDTYRLVGYLVDEEDKNDVWKLFARETHRGGRADFYASPANKNMEMKVMLDDRTVPGNPFKDLYNMPNEIKMRHPMFSQGATYQVVELPTSDLASPYI